MSRDADTAAAAIADRGARTDVYVGVLPRRRRRGGRDDLDRSLVSYGQTAILPDSVVALGSVMPPASILMRSGSGDNRHAYWLLAEPVVLGDIENANRRIAHALGADAASADCARILRPPSLNHKHDPPAPVTIERCDAGSRHALRDILWAIPNYMSARAVGSAAQTGRRATSDALLTVSPRVYIEELTGVRVPLHGKIRCPFHHLSVTRCPGSQKSNSAICCGRDVKGTPRPSDPLRLIPPPVYFERLTGLRVGRSGKLRCLFHDDRSPSLHVYREPGRGWYCFGCGRGGSIYDLAALLWGRETRGRDFSELRRELVELMLPLTLVSNRQGSFHP